MDCPNHFHPSFVETDFLTTTINNFCFNQLDIRLPIVSSDMANSTYLLL